MKTVCVTVAALAFVGSAVAGTINVPAGGDIQAAINGASDGDIIQLEAGEYFPAATIDTLGKAVTLRGVPGKGKDGAPTTVIDGQDSIRVLRCSSGEGADTVFENLLITGGLAEGNFPDNLGGGIFIDVSSPTLTNCTFTGNSATYGGGMFNASGSSPTLTDCSFTNNSADGNGGGMNNSFDSSPTLTDCSFTNNSADGNGGGMYNYDNSHPTLTDCTFAGNSATNWGGGMYNDGSSPTLENCTVCSNTPDQIRGAIQFLGDSSIQPVCHVAGDFDGDGDFDADDYAAMAAELGICAGDINGDGIVDGADMGLLLVAWDSCLP